MRIYEVIIEHTRYGANYDRRSVAADTCEKALLKVKKHLSKSCRVASVILIASTN